MQRALSGTHSLMPGVRHPPRPPPSKPARLLYNLQLGKPMRMTTSSSSSKLRAHGIHVHVIAGLKTRFGMYRPSLDASNICQLEFDGSAVQVQKLRGNAGSKQAACHMFGKCERKPSCRIRVTVLEIRSPNARPGCARLR